MNTWMKFNHPISFSTLLLGGFLVVVIPLLGGIYNMSTQLDRMSLEGRRSVKITEEATLKSRQLAEAALALQRAAGQYYVLEDPALLSRLEKSHQRYLDAIAALRAMPLDDKQIALLDTLASREQTLFEQLKARRSTGASGFDRFKPDFEQLHDTVSEMMDQLGLVIKRQQAVLSSTADQVQRTMIWQSSAVILLSLLLAAVLSWLLSRPVRQLSQSIRRLGDDDLETPVRVGGPKDMASLGSQLDWLRQRLIELEAQKRRFFRQVSHELKTPLASLWEAVDLLSNKVVGDLTTQQEEIVGIMHGSVRILRQRIDELLHYQQIMHHTTERAVANVPLDALIAEVAGNLDLTLKAKHLTLTTSAQGVTLRADREQMAVVLDNLLSNAIRFSPEGGRIEVLAERLGQEVRIRVCDQGPGVPKEDGRYIFQPFYQGGNQPPGPIHGSGLGLAIACAHVEAHGGELCLSDDHSSGACFTIRLPLDEETLNHAC